jgi:glycosyltransferase involved in cell wall biosynthesis
VQRDPFIVTRYRSSIARERIRSLLEKNRIDIVHFDLPHLAAYLRDVRGIPKILVHHNVESLRMLRRARMESNYIKRLYFHYQYSKLAALEARICGEFDRCIAVSDFDREQLEKVSQTHSFTVVPNGVDTEYFRPQHTEVQPQGLVWTGGMGSPYNADAVDYFLTAIAPIILREKPGLPMFFVGGQPTKLLLKHAAAHSNIVATGYVDDVRPYVDRAAVFIAPLRSGSGTKLKILNAMAQQKAVVTTPIGAEGIAAMPEKEIVIAQKPADFAKRVLGLIDDSAATAAIGRRAKRLVESRYDWRVIAKEMCGLYNQIAAGSDDRKPVFAGNN